MTEANQSERRQARQLFGELIERMIQREYIFNPNMSPKELAVSLVEVLWPYVSTDDQTILDATLMVTTIRNGAADKSLGRLQIIDECDRLLSRLRHNPKDEQPTVPSPPERK